MSRLGVAVLLLAVGLMGCGFRNAIDRGHDHAARREYHAAYDAYRRAAALDPDSEEVARHVAQLRPYAIAELRSKGLAALERGRYEEAVKQAAAVGRIDAEAGRQLTDQVAARTRAALEGMLLEQRHEQAYPFALRCRRLFPAMAGLGERLQRIRRHFYARAEDQAAAGRFDDALTSLAWVQRYEPEQAGEVDRRRTAIRQQWAQALARRAAQAERDGKVGAAAALHGRAFEVAGRAEDGAAIERLAEVLRWDGRFVVAPTYQGDAPRTTELQAAVAVQVDDLAGLAWYGEQDDGAHLILTVGVPAPTCAESRRQGTAAQPYVAGHREVPNPRLDSLNGEVRDAAAERRVAVQRHDQARAQASSQLAQADRCVSRRLGPAEAERQRAEAQRQTVAAQLTRAERRLSRLEQRLEAMAARAKARGELEQRVDQARARVSALRQDLEAADTELRRTERRARRARRICRAARDAAQAAAAEQEAAAQAVSSADAQLAQLRAERDATPATVTEAIVASYRYSVVDVTRQCGVTVQVRQQPAWDAEQSSQISARHATCDQTHPAHPRYGVVADPLQLDRSDQELVAAADAEVAAELAVLLRGRTQEYYRTMADRALERCDAEPERATDLMLAILLVAPGQLDAATRARFQSHLTARYGLRRWQTLAR